MRLVDMPSFELDVSGPFFATFLIVVVSLCLLCLGVVLLLWPTRNDPPRGSDVKKDIDEEEL